MPNDNADITQESRRQQILEALNRQGRVKVADLSRLFGTSEVTIRADLSEMEAGGLLERVHGGAVTTQKAYFRMTLEDHMRAHADEKMEIARKAAELVRDGSSLIMSTGTTPIYVLRELKQKKNLTVITNSLPLAHEAGYCRNAHVILLGGSLDENYRFTYGDDATAQLRRYKADLLILSADGFSAEEGVSTQLMYDAEVNRRMAERANRTIAVADSSKIGRVGLALVGEIGLLDCLITHRAAPEAALEAIREKGVEIITA